MTFDPEIHHRRSIRLRDYDYSTAGAYFVTICTWEKKCLFGDVVNGVVRLNEPGAIVQQEWLLTGASRDYVMLDEFIVMPNHFHAILIFDRRGTACRAQGVDGISNLGTDLGTARRAPTVNLGTARRAPTVESFGQPISGSLATVIRSFKSAVTKRINESRANSGAPVWQRNYYERVIRDDHELDCAREYIVNNPLRWDEDENNLR